MCNSADPHVQLCTHFMLPCVTVRPVACLLPLMCRGARQPVCGEFSDEQSVCVRVWLTLGQRAAAAISSPLHSTAAAAVTAPLPPSLTPFCPMCAPHLTHTCRLARCSWPRTWSNTTRPPPTGAPGPTPCSSTTTTRPSSGPSSTLWTDWCR